VTRVTETPRPPHEGYRGSSGVGLGTRNGPRRCRRAALGRAFGPRFEFVDELQQRIVGDGLDEPTSGAVLFGASDERWVDFCGQHQDRRVVAQRLRLLQHLEPSHPWHVDIEKDESERRVLPQRLQSFETIERFDDLVARSKGMLDLSPDKRGIIDNQDFHTQFREEGGKWTSARVQGWGTIRAGFVREGFANRGARFILFIGDSVPICMCPAKPPRFFRVCKFMESAMATRNGSMK